IFSVSTFGIPLLGPAKPPSVLSRSREGPGDRSPFGRKNMASSKITRRRLVSATAVASAAFVAAPFVRGAYAAGNLTLGLWDYWVPNANDATKALVDEWAAKEKVEVQIDFITSQGNKLLLTGAAEAQAKSGHDIFALSGWLPSRYANLLVPLND